MKKLLSIIILTLSLSGNSFAEEMSLTIIDKFFQDGNKVCKEEGYGEYLLTDNPIKLIDISNDGIKDIIIDTSKQRCEKSYSWFAGGTGGKNLGTKKTKGSSSSKKGTVGGSYSYARQAIEERHHTIGILHRSEVVFSAARNMVDLYNIIANSSNNKLTSKFLSLHITKRKQIKKAFFFKQLNKLGKN